MENREEISKIIKKLDWIPVIKQIIFLGGKWEELKNICEPLGLNDTAFRDNPTQEDFLLDEEYWKDRIKELTLNNLN